MRRLVLLAALAALARGLAAAPPAPTCELLVAALPASLEAAREVEIAVTLEQGGRELAYERSLVARAADGTREITVLERRGLRRPDGPARRGAGEGDPDAYDLLSCEDHVLALEPDGSVLLLLRDADPDAPVAAWTLRFARVDEAWRPLELVAPFEVRVLFVPVRGRFVTHFGGWAFGPP